MFNPLEMTSLNLSAIRADIPITERLVNVSDIAISDEYKRVVRAYSDRELAGLKAVATGATKKAPLVPIGTNGNGNGKQNQSQNGRALDVLARQAKVSAMTYYRGRELLTKASSEQKERVLSGKYSINK